MRKVNCPLFTEQFKDAHTTLHHQFKDVHSGIFAYFPPATAIIHSILPGGGRLNNINKYLYYFISICVLHLYSYFYICILIYTLYRNQFNLTRRISTEYFSEMRAEVARGDQKPFGVFPKNHPGVPYQDRYFYFTLMNSIAVSEFV